MSAAEYRIAAIADFLAVPIEKQAECLRDFALWLDMARERTAIGSDLTETLGGRITFDISHFFWIDDGFAGCSTVQLNDEGSDRSVRISIEGGEA